ncbi:serine-rich adhesin for platelets-like isoform X2 [Eurosta solidaginis]|uniref:serine-rich adhesin for platelets-like isoform X2 n=1 Tax=Eurosta solidaginis TaxID=178769 RepID=UPI00353079FE
MLATNGIRSKKSDVSDLEEPDLKKLLEEAYTYKTPKDKKDKSEIFLDLLQKVENEDLGITSTRSDNHRHHPHSQSRHQQKQGGSLQDLLQLPSDFRRQNHTSRHKKNSSVSSRQREGGSLPSNVNVANCLLNSFEQQASVYARRAFLLGVESGTVTLNSGNNSALIGVCGGASGVINASSGGPATISSCSTNSNSTSLCNKESGNSVGANVSSLGGGGNMATTASGHNVGSTMAAGAGIVNAAINTANSIKSTGDYIINIGDMIDIQQQQQILPSKAQDGGQGLPFYERVDIDMRIPRPSLHRGGDVDYAPTRSHHYVDEVIRFHQIDSSENSLCESGEVAISVNTLGNTLKSAAASCSLPMPLDERYRSLKSVMGEKGDGTGVNVSSALSAKVSGATVPNSGNCNSITNSNTSGVVGGSSSNSIGIGNYAKSLPLSRQTDENGNDCERQQHSGNNIISSAGQSQAKAKAKKKPQKDNTIPVDVENEAGYRGKDPVEVLVKFIENTEEETKQSSGGGSNKFSENYKKKERKKEKVKQNKMKKSNSLEELRSCAKIDVGELKQSAATTESNNVTMRGKGHGGGSGSKGSKNNSASTADINKNFDGGSKETAATTASSGGKQINVVSTAASSTTTMNNCKGERRSWGTEELQYLGTDDSEGVVGSVSLVNSTEEKVKEKKEKKSKDKEKEKDRERDVEKEKGTNKEKEKEKDSDRHDKLVVSNKVECGNTKSERHEKNEKLDKIDKQEKPQEKFEKTEKFEKRKKSENTMQTTVTPLKTTSSISTTNLDLHGNSTPVISAIDLLSMNTLISETAEFHVVTKKKKLKKQRAFIDEAHFTSGSNYNNSYNYNNNNNNGNNSGMTGGFQRGHNSGLNTQKGNNNNGSAYGNQQQTRYKHYNNNAHGFNNNYGNNSSCNNNSGDGGRLDYHNNYNSNYSNNYNTNNNHSHQQYGHQQQSQYHQQQQQHQNQQQQHQHQNKHQHTNAHNTSSGSTNKSRRKSTSSVPPSEKSDSSDIDSVHSLPIESTASSTTKSKQQQQQRHKPASSTTTTPDTPKSSTSSGSPGSAPISYAHIAASAAVDRWPINDAAVNKDSTSNTTANGSVALNVSSTSASEPQSQQQQQQQANNPEIASRPVSNANSTASSHTSSTNLTAKVNKTKKQANKPDFPELVATNTINATITDVTKTVATSSTSAPGTAVGSVKIISYSQSLVAPPVLVNSAASTVNAAGPASVEKVAITTVEVFNMPAAIVSNHNVQDVSQIDPAINSNTTTRLPQYQPQPHQQQQQQQQTLQKSKSVEHDSYSYNSSNLDQQYPALEKTVKRHSTTNISATATAAVIPPTAAAGPTFVASSSILITPTIASSTLAANTGNSGKFNFAAAAKQLPTNKNVVGSQQTATAPISTPDASTKAAHVSQLPNPTEPITTSSTHCSMATAAALPLPLSVAANTSAVNSTTIAIVSPPSVGTAARKSKEKSPTALFAPVQLPTNAVAHSATITTSSSRVPDSMNHNRKAKKDKAAHQLLAAETALALAISGEQLTNIAQKSSTATQTQTSSMDAIVSDSKTKQSQQAFGAGSEKLMTTPTLGKTHRQQTSSCSKSHAASIGTGTTSNSLVPNRPAVIILNDDHSGDSSIEFTFGDFDEDELKFFDDNLAEEEYADDHTIEYEEAPLQEQHLHQQLSSNNANTATESRDTAASTNQVFFNSSSTAYVDSETLPSFSRQGNIKSKQLIIKEDVSQQNVSAVNEKGVSKFSDTENSANYNENFNEEHALGTTDAEHSQQQSRRNSETPQLQQLETCNEIETAIIAAARAAAEHQHPQPMQPPSLPQQQHQQQQQQQQRPFRHKHQQQQQYRSTSYGNAYEPSTQRSEHRSQSSYTRDTSNHYQPQQQNHYHNQYHSQHQHNQHQQKHSHYHQNSNRNSASRSRSSSSNNNTNSFDASGSSPPAQRSPNPSPAVVVNIQRKEFDIHFIPPTMSSAHSALQHNEIIVEFIGAAWEEVSKVTKFYEGQ